MYKLVKRERVNKNINSVISLLLSITEFSPIKKNILDKAKNIKFKNDELLITYFDKIFTESDDDIIKLFQYDYYTKIVCLYGKNMTNKFTSSIIILTVTSNTDVKLLLNDIKEFIDADNGHEICKISDTSEMGYGPFYKENCYDIPSVNRYLLIFLNRNNYKHSVNLNYDIVVDNYHYILDGIIIITNGNSKYIKVIDESYNSFENRQNAVILLYRRQLIF